jgi:SPOR domain
MKQILLILSFILAGMGLLKSQTPADSVQKSTEADPRLAVLVKKHTESRREMKRKGYRIQIYFGADKAKAKEMKAKFLARYSEKAKAYDIYEVPNFKIRVGDFRSRLEAYRFLREIKGDFPTAFIVESDIEHRK